MVPPLKHRKCFGGSIMKRKSYIVAAALAASVAGIASFNVERSIAQVNPNNPSAPRPATSATPVARTPPPTRPRSPRPTFGALLGDVTVDATTTDHMPQTQDALLLRRHALHHGDPHVRRQLRGDEINNKINLIHSEWRRVYGQRLPRRRRLQHAGRSFSPLSSAARLRARIPNSPPKSTIAAPDNAVAASATELP